MTEQPARMINKPIPLPDLEDYGLPGCSANARVVNTCRRSWNVTAAHYRCRRQSDCPHTDQRPFSHPVRTSPRAYLERPVAGSRAFSTRAKQPQVLKERSPATSKASGWIHQGYRNHSLPPRGCAFFPTLQRLTGKPTVSRQPDRRRHRSQGGRKFPTATHNGRIKRASFTGTRPPTALGNDQTKLWLESPPVGLAISTAVSPSPASALGSAHHLFLRAWTRIKTAVHWCCTTRPTRSVFELSPPQNPQRIQRA